MATTTVPTTAPVIIWHGHKQAGRVADPVRGGVAFPAYYVGDGLFKCSYCHCLVTHDDPSVWCVSRDGQRLEWR